MGRELIKFCKKLEVKADMTDPKASTTFEFARQMASHNLAKINPDFKCSFDYVKDEPPSVYAEYVDGGTWSAITTEYKLNELRNAFFEGAMVAEEKVDDDEFVPREECEEDDDLEEEESERKSFKRGKEWKW